MKSLSKLGALTVPCYILLHLTPFKFQCAEDAGIEPQDCCDFVFGSQTLYTQGWISYTFDKISSTTVYTVKNAVELF
jgi:hypothetical protein